MPRNQRRNNSRPATVEPKVRPKSANENNEIINDESENDDINLNNENDNNIKTNANYRNESPLGSDYEVDINDDKEYDTDIEADGKIFYLISQTISIFLLFINKNVFVYLLLFKKKMKYFTGILVNASYFKLAQLK